MKRALLLSLSVLALGGCSYFSAKETSVDEENAQVTETVEEGKEATKQKTEVSQVADLYDRQNFTNYDEQFNYLKDKYGDPVSEQITYEIQPGQDFKMDTFYDSKTYSQLMVGQTDIAPDSKEVMTFLIIAYPDAVEMETALSTTIYANRAEQIKSNAARVPLTTEDGTVIVYEPAKPDEEQPFHSVYFYDLDEYVATEAALNQE